MKRFYTQVSVCERENGFGVELDGKPIKTPAGNPLLAINKKLADELAVEWQAQEKEILPHTMPVNQIVITSIDSERPRGDIESHILSYIDTDLLFYRSDISPYKEQQDRKWSKWTDWLDNHFSVSCQVTYEITALKQSPEMSLVFKNYIQTLDLIDLTLFESMVEDTSSPVLTLAFFAGVATAEDLYEAVLVDDLVRAEIYNEEKYGAAPDQEKKRKTLRHNLEAAQKIRSALVSQN